MIATILAHAGSALVAALIATLLCRLRWNNTRVMRIVFVVALFAMQIPLLDYSGSHYLRALTGDVSIIGMVIFSLLALEILDFTNKSATKTQLSLVLLVIALLLYPTALGLIQFDLYRYGYYPIILGPLVFALFAWCVWFSKWLGAALLATGFMGYAFGVLESDNLWDYLIDPVIAVWAIVHLIRHRANIPLPRFTQQQIEVGLSLFALTFLVFAIYLSRANPDAFRHEFVVEDGFVEWCTVVILAITCGICARRLIILRSARNGLFLTVTGLLTLLCLFGAGEEISWGQRIFGIETPEYFKEHNAQEEMGFHNLVVEINGEEVKLNKLIFGTGLAIALLIYLFVATPLYRTKPMVTRFFNAIAAPMPRNWQIIGYLVIVATVELLIDSSKRGEMTEFAGSLLFAMNVIFPYNPEIFDPKQPLSD